ncbi:ras-related protein Rab-39B isoform 3-T3 [Ciconia maguari]
MEAIWLYQFRLIVIGDSTVGKSCLIRRFTEGRFAQISDPTVGVDFFSRLVEIEPGKRIKLQIWDTAGQERFRSITRAYYRNSVGGLLLFDITNRRSFQNVHEWLEETKVHVQPYQIVFVLVGHKCDLDTQRQVTRHEAEKLAAAYAQEGSREIRRWYLSQDKGQEHFYPRTKRKKKKKKKLTFCGLYHMLKAICMLD